jgi:hypothetical protein
MEIRTLDKEVEPMIEPAREAGIQVAPPSQRYTLIVDRSLYKDDELKNDRAGYDTRVGRMGAADRFDLKAVDTSNVGNILANITDPANTVIQISSELSQAEMNELSMQAPGVRVIRVNTLGFTSDPELNNAARRDARFDLYAMMLLARRVTEKDIAESSSIYRVLSFMIETRIMSGQIAAATDYIKAIATDSLLKVIKTNLSYVPAAKWRTPRYEEVAATLISA